MGRIPTEIYVVGGSASCLNKRDRARKPNISIPQACGGWGATQEAYDFWAF
ncbi:transposase DNA-binding-containing protein [Laspinema palackyanum]|uniref:transposase DNA-binding-containing protein n=1 Tax=Laspinema palackyanum TaxID=3231601 RepID=UPI00349F4332